MDYRGRQNLLRRPHQDDQQRRHDVHDGGSDLRHQFPHQLHAGRGDGLRRANGGDCLRIGPDPPRSAGGMRWRQRRLPDHCRAADAGRSQPGCFGSDQALLHLGAAGRRGCPVRNRERERGPRHGRRSDPGGVLRSGAASDNVRRFLLASHGAGATHAIPVFEAVSICVRGRLPAQRRAGWRRRSRRFVAQ